jgi:hypothetical protein
LLAVGCSYHPRVPDGVLACGDQGQGSCPAGFTCAPAAGDPSLHVCKREGNKPADGAAPKETRDAASPPDAAPPDRPLTVDLAPELAPEHAAAPDQPAETGAAPADASPPDVVADAAGSDLVAADAGDSCPPGKGGPRLKPAGKFCIDESEVTNGHYRVFLDKVVRSELTLPPECAAKTDFIPVSSPEVMWSNQRPADFPVVNIDWCDAYAFCAWAGKRLCGKIDGGVLTMNLSGNASVSQWASACSRDGTRLYPYGAAGDGMCNTRKPRMPIAFGAVKSYPRCEGGYPGVFDLVGNVEEWIDACGPSSTTGGDCAVVGGAFAPESENPDCLSWFPGHRLDNYFRRGFRCCSK